MNTLQDILPAIRRIHNRAEGALPLHAPVFSGNERQYVLDTIDSTFVSSVGAYVTRFEDQLREVTGARHAIACVNGTAALQVAMLLAGVQQGDLVLTQAMSFVATANAIRHCGAEPVFLDIDAETLGLSVDAVRVFLEKECERAAGGCRHIATGRRVAACVPMHSFGLPCRVDVLCGLCATWGVAVVEDAAEALGSTYKGRHCGTWGLLGTLSFNGNKIITTGGGGAILTDDDAIGKRARHLTTTAKVPHRWDFYHDEVAWNYRMPNLNAALGCAQLERLEEFVAYKRGISDAYAALFADSPWQYVRETEGSRSNYWLCAVLFGNEVERDAFLELSNDAGIMTRPVWRLLHTLPAFRAGLSAPRPVAADVAARLVNLPSGFGE